MKDFQNPAAVKSIIKGRPDYYITPTHDFTQYTKDSEQKYYTKDSKFDWSQNILDNLKEHLANLERQEFSKILFLVLPMVAESVERRLVQIREAHLPLEEDALKDIAECVAFDRTAIRQPYYFNHP